MDKYSAASLVGALAALVVGGGGILGIWSSAASLPILAIELATLLLLLINSLLILRWVYEASPLSAHRRAAWLCFLSLVLCIGGDIINFNFPQTYFRHGDVVKHDYLAGSVIFFGPGYTLLLFAVLSAVWSSGQLRITGMALMLVTSIVLSGLSFSSMYIPGAGEYVGFITGGYSFLITLVGLSSVLLIHAYGGFGSSFGIWMIAIGLILAAIADAVIGAFWIYGNGGEGFFPLARDVNWVLYISSQSLVIHLPRALVKLERRNRTVAAQQIVAADI